MVYSAGRHSEREPVRICRRIDAETRQRIVSLVDCSDLERCVDRVVAQAVRQRSEREVFGEIWQTKFKPAAYPQHTAGQILRNKVFPSGVCNEIVIRTGVNRVQRRSTQRELDRQAIQRCWTGLADHRVFHRSDHCLRSRIQCGVCAECHDLAHETVDIDVLFVARVRCGSQGACRDHGLPIGSRTSGHNRHKAIDSGFDCRDAVECDCGQRLALPVEGTVSVHNGTREFRGCRRRL